MYLDTARTFIAVENGESEIVFKQNTRGIVAILSIMLLVTQLISENRWTTKRSVYYSNVNLYQNQKF